MAEIVYTGIVVLHTVEMSAELSNHLFSDGFLVDISFFLPYFLEVDVEKLPTVIGQVVQVGKHVAGRFDIVGGEVDAEYHADSSP